MGQAQENVLIFISFYLYSNPTKKVWQLGMMASACNARSWELQTGGLGIQGPAGVMQQKQNKQTPDLPAFISDTDSLRVEAGESGVHEQPWLHRISRVAIEDLVLSPFTTCF